MTSVNLYLGLGRSVFLWIFCRSSVTPSATSLSDKESTTLERKRFWKIFLYFHLGSWSHHPEKQFTWLSSHLCMNHNVRQISSGNFPTSLSGLVWKDDKSKHLKAAKWTSANPGIWWNQSCGRHIPSRSFLLGRIRHFYRHTIGACMLPQNTPWSDNPDWSFSFSPPRSLPSQKHFAQTSGTKVAQRLQYFSPQIWLE